MLPFGDGASQPPQGEGPTTWLVVLVDYRPAMDRVEAVQIKLPAQWGGPETAHMVLTQMFRTRRRVEVEDVAGDAWSFERETVRAF